MKKRIAILTLYYKNSNYGGVLQSYALQKKLTKLGYDAKQISYLLQSGDRKKNIVHRILRPFVIQSRNLINKKWLLSKGKVENLIYNFAETIPHTCEVTAQTIGSLIDDFDIFICGSDQIWNPIGWQPTLFLDFVPNDKYKIAYAASIARTSLSEDEMEYVLKYTSSFNAISVREENSAKQLMNYNKYKEINVMPDPTLLLSVDEWNEITKPLSIDYPYILAYFLGENITQREKLLKFGEFLGIKVLFIPYMKKSMYKWERRHKDNLIDNVGIEQFLSLIKNSTLFVTDSFHGVVFSLIYKKAFYVMNRFTNSDVYSMNSRIEGLLERMEITGRILEELPKYRNYELDLSEIQKIDKNLLELKKQGSDFLTRELSKYANKVVCDEYK